MIDEQSRLDMLATVSPEAIRERLLARRSLVLALISGENLLVRGVRPGGPEEMLRLLRLRAPLPELVDEEVITWRQMDQRHEDLYQAYLRGEV